MSALRIVIGGPERPAGRVLRSLPCVHSRRTGPVLAGAGLAVPAGPRAGAGFDMDRRGLAHGPVPDGSVDARPRGAGARHGEPGLEVAHVRTRRRASGQASAGQCRVRPAAGLGDAVTLCDAAVCSCRCVLLAGHRGICRCVEDCGGQWVGTPGTESFAIVRLPGPDSIELHPTIREWISNGFRTQAS